jgi:hypothetical protein
MEQGNFHLFLCFRERLFGLELGKEYAVRQRSEGKDLAWSAFCELDD